MTSMTASFATGQSYFLGGNELKVVVKEKDLGVVFESFSWCNHIQESIGKAKKNDLLDIEECTFSRG